MLPAQMRLWQRAGKDLRPTDCITGLAGGGKRIYRVGTSGDFGAVGQPSSGTS